MTIADELIKKGESIDMCKTFMTKMVGKDRLGLVRLYKVIPNWCLENRFPEKEYMKKHFSAPEIEARGFFVDTEVNKVLTESCYVFNGCRGIIKTKFNVKRPHFPMIYLGLDSNMDLTVDGFNCTVELYDDSSIKIQTINGGRCRVYNYGQGSVYVDKNDNVEIYNKSLNV